MPLSDSDRERLSSLAVAAFSDRESAENVASLADRGLRGVWEIDEDLGLLVVRVETVETDAKGERWDIERMWDASILRTIDPIGIVRSDIRWLADILSAQVDRWSPFSCQTLTPSASNG